MTRFDLQAHRGGAGLWPENTLEAFGRALALGVSTLELDVHLTAEDDVVVAHDPVLADARRIRTLVRSQLPPTMPLLRQVAALLHQRRADGVRVNLEIKYDAVAAACDDGVTTREAFVRAVAEAIRVDGLLGRTTIQCFDWEVLGMVRAAEPRLGLNVLASNTYLQPGKEGASPWLGGADIDDYTGGFVEAAAEHGFDAISPIHGSPYLSGVDDPSYVAFADVAMVQAAHAVGLRVIPYVVDDPPTMRRLVRAGVDGLITNHPERLREVLADEGIPLPTSHPG